MFTVFTRTVAAANVNSSPSVDYRNHDNVDIPTSWFIDLKCWFLSFLPGWQLLFQKTIVDEYHEREIKALKEDEHISRVIVAIMFERIIFEWNNCQIGLNKMQIVSERRLCRKYWFTKWALMESNERVIFADNKFYLTLILIFLFV